MNKSKLNKDRLSVLVIAIILLAGLWVIIIHPFLKFHQNESAFKSAAERYFELNKQFLPQEGNVTTVSGLTLYDKKFIGINCNNKFPFFKHIIFPRFGWCFYI